MNKMNRMQKRACCLGLALVMSASNVVGYLPPMNVQAAMNENAPQAFKDLIDQMKAQTPKGQEWLSYSENFQSMEPEQITYLQGTGSHDKTTTTGKLTVNLNGEPTVAVFDKCPWLSSGYMDMDFKYSGATGNIGFIYKAFDKADSGVGIRYDGGTSWVIQLWSAGNASYKVVTGPTIAADTEYNFKMGFHENKLILAINDEVFYNEESAIISGLEKGTQQGQLGLYKRNGKGTFTISNLELAGNGTTTKPSSFVTYENDYEDESYTPNWNGGTAQVKSNDTGTNKFLQITGNGRFADLSSKKITDGSISLDYNIVNIGAGYAFGFRHNDSSSSFSELGWDGTRWIAESNNGWSGTLDIPKPVEGKWNNLILNFQGKKVTVYLNKQYVGEFPFDKFTTDAGFLGLRLRGTTMQIDNVKYTSEILAPEKVLAYNNNYDDGVAGTWSTGTGTVVSEGSNKILKLSGIENGTTLTDGVELESGTFTASVKTAASKVGVSFANSEDASNVLEYNGTAWIAKIGEQELTFDQLPAPRANAWNKIGVQFAGTSIKASVNGTEQELTATNAISAKGSLGFAANGDLYVDNVLYSEELNDMDTSNSFDKVYFDEYFETISSTTIWKGLSGASIADGRLQGSIAAGGQMVNTDETVTVTANGVYQAKLKADSNKLGLQIGNAKVYHKGDGNWVLNDGTEKALGKSDALKNNEDVIIRAEIVKNELTLKVNGFYIGKATLAAELTGTFGVCNADTKAINVKVDAIGMEEIRVYNEDYTTTATADAWKMQAGSAAIVTNAAELTLNGVSKGTNTASPKLNDQHIALDIKSSVDASDNNGVGGGRYGVLVREDGTNKFLSVETDVNGEWRIQTDNATVKFPTKMALIKDKTYRMEIDVVGQNVSLAFTNEEGNRTELGTVSDDSVPQREGHLGVRSWYSGKKLTIDNIEMIEEPSIPNFILDAKTTTLSKDGMTVTIDEMFPRIESYVLNGKTLKAQEDSVSNMMINSKAYTPRVVGTKVSETEFKYDMSFEEIDVDMTVVAKLKENHVVEVAVTKINEKGEFKVRTMSFGDNALAMVDSSMKDSSFAWGKSSGAWHGITEELIDDLKAYEGQSGKIDTTMTMLSGGGLGFSVENNVMNGGGKVQAKKEIKSLVKRISAYNGTFTYRHQESDATEALPVYKVVVTEDTNKDQKVDWQDAAVAYRENVYNKVVGADDTKNSMMYIPFNFASQAQEPFLGQLDTAKVLYNYMDGFSQMLLDKGYQAEGHDDDIPSYSNIGVRQGGVDEFNYLINEGDKYNVKVGVHLNATEPQLDANELFYQNFSGATLGGTVTTKSTDRLAAGWDWIDTGYYYDQTKDVLSGQLEKRFTDLYNLTNDNKLDANDPTVSFYYIDVYTGNQYNAQKLLDIANNLGIAVGTEFAGPLEPGVAFTHWGTDLGYPNKGNGSLLSRIVKNDLDIFVGNALFKGCKIPVVSTWGDSKMDIQQGVEVFYNEIVPTKFMQHHGVLKATEDEVLFDGGVVSKRNKATGKIELTQNGKLIAKWQDSGTTTAESERHSRPTDVFIPWIWDHSTYEEMGVMDGAKIYHWNTTGEAQTWDVPDFFKSVSKFDLYKTTQYGREFVKTVTVENGKVALDTQKNTPYVLYPATLAEEKKVIPAGKWGEGSPALDFQFNSGTFNKEGSWSMTGDAEIETEAGRTEYSIAKEMNVNRWNKRVKYGTEGGTVSQTMQALEPGEDYTVSVWTQTQAGRKSKIKVEIGGKTYENYVTGADGTHNSNFKYRGSKFQKVAVEFHVPEGVTTGKVSLIAEAGEGNVYYDDVKVWKHTSVEKDVNNTGYVLYEDFENVNEGFGVFEYGGGSLQNHIATDKSVAKYDDNDVVTPADNKQGPVMTWVLDGQNSLKVSEDAVGRKIMTNENSLKLEANKDYNLSFEYTLETRCDYEVYLYSAKTNKYLPLTVNGKTGDKLDLEVALNSGHKDGSQKKVQATFTTKGVDMADDYYRLFFNIKNKNEVAGAKTIDSTLILDNVAIWEKDAQLPEQDVVDKTSLNKVIAEASKLVAANYTSESWAVLTAKLADAKAIAAKEDAKQDEVDNARLALQKAIIELVDAKLVNKTQLKSALEKARKYNSADYTPESFKALAKAISEGDAIYKKADATQAEVVEAVNKINTAISNLKPIGGSEEKNGWYKEEKGLRYYENNKVVANKWVKDTKTGKWMYAGKDGYQAFKWVKDSGVWYYIGTDGFMVKNWKQISGVWYYFNNSGRMLTGWQKISNTWYYLAPSGKMLSGWQKIDGTWYLLASSGKMLTGWQKSGGTWYLLAPSGKMLTGWQRSGGTWYLLASNGKMLTGWQKVGTKWYYLKASGAMATGWIKVGGKQYYLYSDGSMASNKWIGRYYVNAQGVWTKTK